MSPRVLIASDADVRGLLACAAAAREFGTGQLVWLPPGADPLVLSHCQDSVRTQAEIYEHSVVEGPEIRFGAMQDTERLSRLLLEASYAAVAQGAGRVVWAGAAAADARDAIDLDALSGIHTRAMLVERLASLEQGEASGGGFKVQVPYADLTDRQLADLVLDMDLPIWTCWWWSLGRGPRSVPGAELARAEYERWDGILKEAGWREGIPGPATIG